MKHLETAALRDDAVIPKCLRLMASSGVSLTLECQANYSFDEIIFEINRPNFVNNGQIITAKMINAAANDNAVWLQFAVAIDAP